MNLRGLLFSYLCVAAIAALGCTSAIISADRTADGRPLLWKHRDTSNAHSRVAYIPGTGGELAFVGLFNADDRTDSQAWIGMNEAGFAIMNTASYNLKPKGAPSADREGELMALALKRCRTVDDFARMLDTLPRPMGVESNFGVIDALGNGAFFETDDSQYTRYNLKDSPDGILIRTNYSYSGRYGDGSGRMRHANALHMLAPAAQRHTVTPQFLTETLSRSFYRDDTGRNRLNDTVRIIHDLDFIPRYTSVATVVVEGVRPADTLPDIATVARQYIMWTGLGYPPCAVIRPVWCRPGGVESDLQGHGTDNHAPLADRAQKMRLEIFHPDLAVGKKRFLNLDLLSNPRGTGYMQQIIPRNLDTYRRYHQR